MSSGPINAEGNFNHGNAIPGPGAERVMPLFSLQGKTAIVTGAGAGIGLAVAQSFAEAGANVAIWYNSNNRAVERAAEMERDYGVKCRAYKVNTTSYEQVEKATDDVVKEFGGRLDIFVANSGIPWTQGPALEGDISHYHNVVNIDLDGTFYCARAAGKHFRRQRLEGTDATGKPLDQSYSCGSFIATASISGHIVNIPQLQAAYNAAKAGVIQLCKSLAIEWVQFARVNSVSPGYIATEISNFIPQEMRIIWKNKIPMGREAHANELKGVFLFLASDASSYITGADLVVDGGYTLV